MQDMNTVPQNQPQAQPSPERIRPLYRGTQAVWYILVLLEALLAFRFILKLIGANPDAGFSSFIYTVTYPFAQPFIAVVGITEVDGSVFEWTTLLAMVVYFFVAWAIAKLFVMGKPVTTPEAKQGLERQE
jgi:hypothetical protein